MANSIDFKKNDIIILDNATYFVMDVSDKGGKDESIQYGFKTSLSNFGYDFFKADEFEFVFDNKAKVKTLEDYDVFVNSQGLTIIVTFFNVTANEVVFDLIQFDGKKESYVFPIDNFLKKLTMEDYVFKGNGNLATTPTTITPTTEEPTTSKDLNFEGDFISEFVNKNATNLLELEKNNRPLFDVVEMTLNLLNKKFGKGEDVAEKVDTVIENADEIIKKVEAKNPDLIGLKEIKIEWNEGSVDLKGNTYTTWTEFTNALKPLYDTSIGGYNKVKFRATFDDGTYFVDRVDVGEKDFDPSTMKVGEFVDRPFMYYDTLGDDLDKYQWDDEIIVTEGGDEGEVSKEDIEAEISALEVALMYEENADTIKEIEEKINALKITQSLI